MYKQYRAMDVLRAAIGGLLNKKSEQITIWLCGLKMTIETWITIAKKIAIWIRELKKKCTFVCSPNYFGQKWGFLTKPIRNLCLIWSFIL